MWWEISGSLSTERVPSPGWNSLDLRGFGFFVCFFFFLDMPTACRCPWARDRTQATAVTTQILKPLSHKELQKKFSFCQVFTDINSFALFNQFGLNWHFFFPHSTSEFSKKIKSFEVETFFDSQIHSLSSPLAPKRNQGFSLP